MQPRPSCVPNPCHPGVKCMETPQGIQCGPCPDGMQGNGTHCTDIDEVWKPLAHTVLTLLMCLKSQISFIYLYDSGVRCYELLCPFYAGCS